MKWNSTIEIAWRAEMFFKSVANDTLEARRALNFRTNNSFYFSYARSNLEGCEEIIEQVIFNDWRGTSLKLGRVSDDEMKFQF